MVALPAGNRPGRASPLTNTGRDGKTTLSRCGGSLPGERGFYGVCAGGRKGSFGRLRMRPFHLLPG
ncbi:hypothetical protein, partial [Desulfovibrio sp. 1214_IL3152]|uniref:hypothetical protein n=1 Tax=Desulfovibrio sp. 1214_IL3152 TaxID=3084056 RepID=UPI002FD94F42